MPSKTKAILPSKEWLVYILKCGDGTYYTGITNDLPKRLKAHTAGIASRYTRARLPVKAVYRESQTDKSRALRRELEIKKLTRKQKIFLIKLPGKKNKPPA